MSDARIRAWLASPPGRAGVAIVDLEGDPRSLDSVLGIVAPGPQVDAGQASHRRIAEVDDGLLVRLDETHAQLMPHGGLAIVRRLAQTLDSAGCRWLDSPPPGVRFEAEDRVEALALDTMAGAASLATLDPLLRQSAAWDLHHGRLDAEELAARLQEQGVEAVPVADFGDVFRDKTLQARDHFQSLEHPVLGECFYERNGFRLSGASAGYRSPAPLLGQHDEELDEILARAPRQADPEA